MDQVSLRAYAKINLTLDIVGRRKDGYHLLQSVMQSISLADIITLRKQATKITIQTDSSFLPTDETNICWQAATSFLNYTGITDGVVIEINKEIPIAAGLGGGSTDAAAVLQGLNVLFGAKLSLTELQTIGLEIGADVPFCLQGGTAYVQGIGEKVTTLTPFPDVTLVLVKPKVGVSTAEVYRNLNPDVYGGNSTQQLMALLDDCQPVAALSRVLSNSLESVTTVLIPQIEEWKGRLLAGGAHGVLMSGSGPTVFGIFSNEELAQQFQTRWVDHEIFLVKPMRSGVEWMNGGNQ